MTCTVHVQVCLQYVAGEEMYWLTYESKYSVQLLWSAGCSHPRTQQNKRLRWIFCKHFFWSNKINVDKWFIPLGHTSMTLENFPGLVQQLQCLMPCGKPEHTVRKTKNHISNEVTFKPIQCLELRAVQHMQPEILAEFFLSIDTQYSLFIFKIEVHFTKMKAVFLCGYMYLELPGWKRSKH